MKANKKAKTSDKPDWESIPKGKLKTIVEKWHGTSGFGQPEMESLVGIRQGKKEAQAKLEEIGRLRSEFLGGLIGK